MRKAPALYSFPNNDAGACLRFGCPHIHVVEIIVCVNDFGGSIFSFDGKLRLENKGKGREILSHIVMTHE